MSGLSASNPIAALQGRVIWNDFDVRRGGYVLRSRKDGRTTSLRHAPQRRPFDVDLGTDRAGRVVATYSRCRTRAARACDAYSYSFTERRERRSPLASAADVDETWPSMWRGRVAFARRTRHKGRRLSALAVTRGKWPQRSAAQPNGATFFKVELVGTRVAYSVGYLDGRCDDEVDRDTEPYVTEIRLARAGGSDKRVARGCPADPVAQVLDPGLLGEELFFLETKRAEQPGSPSQLLLTTLALRTGKRASQPLPVCTSRLAYDQDLLIVQRPATCGQQGTYLIERTNPAAAR